MSARVGQPAAGAAAGTCAVRGAVSRRSSRRTVRTRKPIPASSSAAPTTIANVATVSAKYAVLSDVWNAVDEIQMLRAGF